MTRKAFNDFAEGFISECMELGFNEHQSATLLTKVAKDVCALNDDKELIKYALMRNIGRGFSKMWGAGKGPVFSGGNMNLGLAARRTGTLGLGAAGLAAPPAAVLGTMGWMNNRGPSKYSGTLPEEFKNTGNTTSTPPTAPTSSAQAPGTAAGPSVDLAMDALGEQPAAPAAAPSPTPSATPAAVAPVGTKFDSVAADKQAQLQSLNDRIYAAKQRARTDARVWSEVDKLSKERDSLTTGLNSTRQRYMSKEMERDKGISEVQRYIADGARTNRERAMELNEHLYNRRQTGYGPFGYKRLIDWSLGRTQDRAAAFSKQRDEDARLENRLKQLPADYYYPQS